MKIDETILVLAISDNRNHKLAKYPRLYCGHNFYFKNITEPLEKIFTDFIGYDFTKRYIEIGTKKINQEIIDIVESKHPKYVFWPSSMYEIQESTFQAIQDEGTIVIGWFFDDEVRFDNYSKWWIPYLDYILTTDKQAVEKYKKLGEDAFHLLVFSSPDCFKKINLPKIYDVSFVGTNIANRQEIIDTLNNEGIPVRTFGSGWSSGYVSLNDMVKIYNQSKINLSFMRSYGQNTRSQMKCKIFDICMCGGFLLCEYIPGIEEYYKIGKEIECFNNIKEATEKIKYYLRHKDEREIIANAGWKRANAEHTNFIRLSDIFQEIEKDIKIRGNIKTKTINSKLLKMPKYICKLPSNYHCDWGEALLRENYKNLWKDELLSALSYNKLNLRARYLYIVGCFPSPIRAILLRINSIIRRIQNYLLKIFRILKNLAAYTILVAI